MDELLALTGVTKLFGGLSAVSGVTLTFRAGEITAIIGPNGAGKTTLFSMIAGALRPTSGRILFRGRDITGLRPDRVCRLGLARTFQVVRPFWDLTVGEHLRAAGAFGGHHELSERELGELADLTGLATRMADRARTLTLAGCKRLEIARALATGANLLLLDETMAGLTPEETADAISLVRRVRAAGRSIVLIEHVLAAVTTLCDRAVVLDYGEVIADGAPAEVLASAAVRRAYLGED